MKTWNSGGRVLALATGLVCAAGSSALATPESAKPADTFVDSFGVNIKLDYKDTPYADFAKVKQVLQDSGIRNLRVGTGQPDELSTLGNAGFKLTCLMQPSQAGMSPEGWGAEILASLHPLQPWLAAIEGPNEPDGGYMKSLQPFPGAVIAYQKLLYQVVKGDPQLANIPVIVPSLGSPPKSAQMPNQPGDQGNIHSYHGSRPPETGERNLDLDKFYLGNAATEFSGKTFICTEFGNPTNSVDDPNLWMPRITELAQAKYTLRTFCYYFEKGIPRTFVHELVDEHPNPGSAESNFGLLRNDWSPKPAYLGIKNLLHLLADPATDTAAWQPGQLDYNFTGDTANLHHLLLEKRDGTYYLVLWQAAKSYDYDRKLDMDVADAQVTVTSHTPLSAALIYSTLGFGTPGPAIKTQDAVSVAVPDYPIVVELIPRGPDLVITAFSTVDPAHVGQPVKFKATLKNQGTAKTPEGTILAVTFFDRSNGGRAMLTYSSTFHDSLEPGQSVDVASDGTWTPKVAGDISIEALADDTNRVAESDKTNNSLLATVHVAGP